MTEPNAHFRCYLSSHNSILANTKANCWKLLEGSTSSEFNLYWHRSCRCGDSRRGSSARFSPHLPTHPNLFSSILPCHSLDHTACSEFVAKMMHIYIYIYIYCMLIDKREPPAGSRCSTRLCGAAADRTEARLRVSSSGGDDFAVCQPHTCSILAHYTSRTGLAAWQRI